MPLFIALALLLAACATSAPSRMGAAVPAAQSVSSDRAETGSSRDAQAANSVQAASRPAGATDATPVAVASATPADAPEAAQAGDDEDDADDDTDVGEEAESHDAVGDPNSGFHYTAEISDAELARIWKTKPSDLGSVSVGFVDAGRLLNGIRFPDSDDWRVVSPEKTYATSETIAYVQTAIRAVRSAYPNAPPLRVNQISAKEGGYIRPHQSHQNGRDVDLAFYYPGADPIRARAREKVIDVALNWALIKALATQTDVQVVLVDRRVQKVLYDYARGHGEELSWLNSLFHGPTPLLKHAKRHRDHFHVRFYNPRAQELGHRIAPLLALQPEFNVAMHRVRPGDSLGQIARKYGTTAMLIRKANHLKNSAIRAGITLSIPLRGACTAHCPIPPAVIVPPRRLPTALIASANQNKTSNGASTSLTPARPSAMNSAQ